MTNYANFIWETLPATATDADHAETADFDGDGAINFEEWTAGTEVTNPQSVFRVTSSTRSGDTISITFPTVAGRTYTFESSTDLVNWDFIPEIRIGNGNPLTVTFGGALRLRPPLHPRPRRAVILGSTTLSHQQAH